MPLGKSRLRTIKTPEPEVPVAGAEQFGTDDAGKRTGEVISGMASFYGNIMKSAVEKVKKRESEVEPPPFG